jgi:hypothetical protein
MMGNDRKPTADVAKAPPGAAYAVLAASLGRVADESRMIVEGLASPAFGALGGSQLDPGAPVDYCERVHVLRFETRDGANPRLHQEIRLRIASPPHVIDTEGEPIGVLCDPQESAILRCLVDRYMMMGEIVSLDADGEYGKVRVSGRLEAELG